MLHQGVVRTTGAYSGNGVTCVVMSFKSAGGFSLAISVCQCGSGQEMHCSVFLLHARTIHRDAHYGVHQVCCAMQRMVVVERHVPALGDPQVSLAQGIFAVDDVFSPSEICGGENKIVSRDRVFALLVQVAKPRPVVLKLAQDCDVVLVLCMLFWEPVEGEAVELTTPRPRDFGYRAIWRTYVAGNIELVCRVLESPDEEGSGHDPKQCYQCRDCPPLAVAAWSCYCSQPGWSRPAGLAKSRAVAIKLVIVFSQRLISLLAPILQSSRHVVGGCPLGFPRIIDLVDFLANSSSTNISMSFPLILSQEF